MLSCTGPFSSLLLSPTLSVLFLKLSPLNSLNVSVLVQAISGLRAPAARRLHGVHRNHTDLPLCASVLSVALPGVKDIKVYDETSTTMKVTWDEVGGATGYMLLYKALNAAESEPEKEVKSSRHQQAVSG